LLVLTCLVLFPGHTARGQTVEPAALPSLASAVRVKGPLEIFGERVPLESQEVRERLEKELLLTLWDRPQVLLWLKRSRRYLPIIEEELRTNGMPDDLKFVAIAESALRPHVGSPKGAMGFWQFTQQTGRTYGLRIDRRVDERRNIHASTDAAVLYFKDLHAIFGSWTLAAAAFNTGEHGLMAEILLQGTRDYYQLYLPLETQRFVMRIISVKLIFAEPDRYGFSLLDDDYYPPLKTEAVQLDCLQEVPIRVIARAAGTHFKMIKDLNPEIRGHFIAAGKHRVLVPQGGSEGFDLRYRDHLQKYLAAREERVYVVQKGDSLSAIAEKFDIPLQVLLIQNRLNPRQPIHPGDRLIVLPNHTGMDEATGDTEQR